MHAPRPNAIDIFDLNFGYGTGTEHLKDVALSVKPGEVVLITGPSGCGKTTLTRFINGLIPHFYEGDYTGEVHLFGRQTRALAAWEFGKITGCVFQNPKSQFFASVVQDELAFSAENYGMPAPEMLKRREAVIKRMHLAPLQNQSVHALSSGEKQKVAFASAMMLSPKLYVLDEPSANLDMPSALALRSAIMQLRAEGSTFVIAEHRLYYILDLIDRVYYMKDGRIQQCFSAEAFRSLSPDQVQIMGLRGLTPHLTLPAQDALQTRSAPLVSAQNITYHYRGHTYPILKDVCFEIFSGEVVAITGPNGAGKTTLAKLMCGLLKEKSGTLRYSGQSVRPRFRQRHVWFVMQETGCQLFSESVSEEMTLGIKETKDATQRSQAYLEQLGLSHKSGAHPAALSGGEAQRLTFGVAMMQDTEIILFDEPTSGLDGANLQRVIAFMNALKAAGKAVIVITHDHELIAGACTRLLMLDSGKIVQDAALTQPVYDALINQWYIT